MKIKSKHPSVEVCIKGTFYRFVDGIADIPDEEAIELLAGHPENYSLIDSVKDRYLQNLSDWSTHRRVIFDAPVGFHNGYGHWSMEMGQALSSYTDLFYLEGKWIGYTDEYMNEKLRSLIKKKTSTMDAAYIMLFPAWEFARAPVQRLIGYTMLECTLVPESWVEILINSVSVLLCHVVRIKIC